jgi:hypothetical protein
VVADILPLVMTTVGNQVLKPSAIDSLIVIFCVASFEPVLVADHGRDLGSH